MNLVFNKYLLPSQPYYNIWEYLVAWKPTLTPSDLYHIKQQLLLLFKLTKPNNAISTPPNILSSFKDERIS